MTTTSFGGAYRGDCTVACPICGTRCAGPYDHSGEHWHVVRELLTIQTPGHRPRHTWS